MDIHVKKITGITDKSGIIGCASNVPSKHSLSLTSLHTHEEYVIEAAAKLLYRVIDNGAEDNNKCIVVPSLRQNSYGFPSPIPKLGGTVRC